MLHKLLKHNLHAVYRPLALFYIIALVCAIIGRIFNNYDDNLIFKIVHEFFSGAALGLCFGIIINNATRIWEYTKRNFYGEQSYLTHTLPVPRTTLYLAKFCATVITVATSLLVITAIVFINYASPDFFEFIRRLVHDCGSTAEFIKFATLIIGVLFLEIIFIIQVGITGIILGHKSNNHKGLMSFIYAFALFVCSNIITVLLTNLWGVFDPEVSRMIHQSFSTNSVMTKLLGGAVCIYLAYIASIYYIGRRSLQHGVNVD